MRAIYVYLVVCAFAGSFLSGAAFAAETPADSGYLALTPRTINITKTFSGANVEVSADIPKGAGAVLELIGPTRDSHLLRQGRRAGLWMSVGEVTAHDAPSIYMVFTTPDVKSLETADSPSGYDALKQRVTFSGALPKNKADLLFGQFIKLKESEKLYGSFPGALETKSGAKHDSVHGALQLPSNVAPGSYDVTLMILQNGKGVERRSAELTIMMTGLPKILTNLAFNHAGLYGLMAVLVALIAGITVGLIFTGKGGAH